MKANLKGMHGVKGLLLKHCEKIVMAVIVACAVMFIYSSLSLQPLPPENEPQELDRLISQAKTKVEGFRWEDAGEEDVVQARPLAGAVAKEVPPQAYQISPQGFDTPVVAPTVLRTDPLLLAARQVEGQGVSGLIAFVDENIRRQRELERAKEEEERAAEREKQQADNRLQEGFDAYGGRGRGRNTRGRDRNERNVYDPDHPNRRPVVGRARALGVPLQGDERVDKFHCAVVVALVPLEDQWKLYRDALENSRFYDPSADYPQYLGYFVERAEVRRGQQSDWQSVRVTDGAGNVTGTGSKRNAVSREVIEKTIKDWVPNPQEVIDPRYYDPVLTFPLPPLVGRDWSKWATHSEVPLAVDAVYEEETILEDEPEETDPDDEPNFFAGTQDPSARGGIGGAYGGPGSRMGAAGMMGAGGYGGYGGEMGGYGGYGGEMGGYGAMMGGYGAEMGGYGGEMGGGYGGGMMTSRRGRQGGMPPEVPHALLRFFDFTVQPGRKYKYRVQLVMTDVNRSSRATGRIVPKNVLDGEVLSRLKKEDERAKAKGSTAKALRYTKWSDAGETISIPLAGSVRVAEARAPAARSYNDEPRVSMLVESFDVDESKRAIQAAKEVEFRRGGVANMVEDAEYLVEGGRAIDLFEDFEFRTDITVVDINGGEKIARDYSAPARVLLMDPAGRLYIRKELEDAEEVAMHEQLFAPPDDNQRGYPGGLEGYGRGFGGEGGGYEGFGF